MTTFNDLLAVSAGIRACAKLPGRTFSLALIENHQRIKEKLTAFEEKYPVDNTLQMRETIFKNKLNSLETEGEKTALSEKFQEENKEAMDAFETRNAAMNDEVKEWPGWVKVRKADLPHTITTEQLAGIEELIIFKKN